MQRSSYRRDQGLPRHDAPVYDDPDDIPLERDLRQRLPTYSYERQQRDEGGRESYSSPVLGAIAAALGAVAVLAWYGTRSDSGNQRRWSGHRSDQRGRLPIDETDDLIASNKVEGTAVYDRNGEKIGTVHNFMVGKRSGRVAYAVISFGGFLGFGEGYHPLPWNALTYDESRGGYVADIDRERLRNAPKHQENEEPFANPAYSRQVREYWLVLH